MATTNWLVDTMREARSTVNSWSEGKRELMKHEASSEMLRGVSHIDQDEVVHIVHETDEHR